MLKLLLYPSVLLLAFSTSAQQDPASATPPKSSPTAAPQTNPVKATPESQAHAKKVYGYDCAMCHNLNGDGKGDVAQSMKLTLKDYTDPAALKDMTDGQLYVVIKDGKGQMPEEGSRAKPDDIWNLVIYIRSMAKKS
jgi:cytochrome c5